MTQHRIRIKHDTSLEARLAKEAERLRRQARQMTASAERQALLRKAKQMDEAREISEILAPPR
jgi:hypothetical protein